MKLSVKEIAIFSVLGAMMYASKMLMEFLPNVHLIGVFVIALTVVYRKKALYPIYIFVLLTGLFAGFATWWLPYLYLWLVLWGVVMLLPQNLPKAIKPIVYMLICGLHGLLYGTLYAPVHMLLFGLTPSGVLAWIAAGLPWDVVHAIGNFFCGILICPLIAALKLGEKHTRA